MRDDKVVYYCGFVTNNIRQRTVFCAESHNNKYMSIRGVSEDIKSSIKKCIKDLKKTVGTQRIELHIPYEHLKDVKIEAEKTRLNTDIIPESNEFNKCTGACFKILYGNFSTEYLAYEMGAYKYNGNAKIWKEE